ncbi:3-deoxy-D-manno-octulosonic acid kinase [Vibrionales bacterium C3R12]|nr:3-deoxy-D-manno-octulosonic acid kinase [Vibrionales bacterium C3R12]
MIQHIKIGNQAFWFDDQLLKEPVEQVFDAEYWHSQGKVTGSATGRGTTWFVQLETMQAALRHYRRGGVFGKLVKDHYWFTGWSKSRSCEEFYLLHKLIDAGVNVPRPIAARVVKRTFCYQADLLSEKIAHAQDLVSILGNKSLSADTYRIIGQQIAKMHQAQVNHTDLNIHNILLDNMGKVWIIDFDKCYLQQGTEWKNSNLNRLLRSFHKECTKCSIHWSESDFEPLLAGYQQQVND